MPETINPAATPAKPISAEELRDLSALGFYTMLVAVGPARGNGLIDERDAAIRAEAAAAERERLLAELRGRLVDDMEQLVNRADSESGWWWREAMRQVIDNATSPAAFTRAAPKGE